LHRLYEANELAIQFTSQGVQGQFSSIQFIPAASYTPYGVDTQSRNLRKKLAQVSCIKFSCKFMQVRLTTHQIKTGVLE